MEEQHLEQLKSKNPELITSVLNEFNIRNADLFTFTSFHNNGLWYVLWKAVFDILDDSALSSLYPLCLNTIRILTRDERSLHTYDISDNFICLLELAQLNTHQFITADQIEEGEAAAVALHIPASETNVEALKCLCNLVFQSVECRLQCIKNNVTDAILKRIACHYQHPFVELYEMKLLFLITALEPSARNRVQIDLNGIDYMTEWLHEKLSDTEYSDEQIDLLSEMLKVMFNITTCPDKSPNENEIQSLHLTGVIRDLLLHFGIMSTDRQRTVITHAINLLTNISTGCLSELMTKSDAANAETTQALNFEGYNVYALDILLRYLSTALNEQETMAGSNELIPPVLTVLVKCARSQRIMRRYIRSRVLPPLKDVSQRPEVGSDLRNQLCRFLTLPVIILRDLSAELLFVCCKENVGRMIKYTGYGNAAGLFANRGLLDCRRVENSAYSSDSENSDTEEYKRLQHAVNPVIGCYEAPKPKHIETMSDEQKEFEALELVKLMDKLQKTGIVQPCRIGEDGKPQPVDHILQLQEELPHQ